MDVFVSTDNFIYTRGGLVVTRMLNHEMRSILEAIS